MTTDQASAFQMPIDRTEPIPGGGVVAYGLVAAGRVRVGDTVAVLDGDAVVLTPMVAGVKVGTKLLDVAGPGDDAGVVLMRAPHDLIRAGQRLGAPAGEP